MAQNLLIAALAARARGLSHWFWGRWIGEVNASLLSLIDLDPVDLMTSKEAPVAALFTSKQIEALPFDSTPSISSDHATIVDNIEAWNRDAIKFSDVHERSNFNVRRRRDRAERLKASTADADAVLVLVGYSHEAPSATAATFASDVDQKARPGPTCAFVQECLAKLA